MSVKLATELRRALRTSIHNNAMVFGYSVMITATFGVLQVSVGTPSLPRIFLFLGGAAAAFTTVEAAASNLFRNRMREERAEAVVLGSAINFLSISGAVGLAALVGELARSWVGWLCGPFAATTLYLVTTAVELTLAARAEERMKD